MNWFNYWKRTLVGTIHLLFHFSFYHKPLISVLNCIVYLNGGLFRIFHFSCGYLLYNRLLISVLKWVIYSNSTLLEAIHLSYDIYTQSKFSNMHWHQWHITMFVLSSSTTSTVICNYVMYFKVFSYEWHIRMRTQLKLLNLYTIFHIHQSTQDIFEKL